ncbi:MAG: FtsX-like permease family protein [Phycisphaerales bacterium]|jgi:putative ABC transport system permease protein
MHPAWRLAISNLSARRSRTLLLATTVALSAALIAAVACAMNSMQSQARQQVSETVGAADVKIKPVSGGAGLSSELLARVRQWPEAAMVVGKREEALTMGVTLRVLKKGAADWTPGTQQLTTNVVATGADVAVSPANGDPATQTISQNAPSSSGVSGPKLLAGRWVQRPGEMVVDTSLILRLSMPVLETHSPMERRTQRKKLERQLPHSSNSLPPTTDDAKAAAINAGIGVQLGDEIEVMRRAAPALKITAALADPRKALGLAKAAGISPIDAGLKALAGFLQAPTKVKIVGIVAPPPFGGRPRAFMTLAGLEHVLPDGADTTGKLTAIEIALKPGFTPEHVVEEYSPALGPDVILSTSTKVTAGLENNIEASRLGFLLATVMAYLAATFIITTAMSTGVTERLRELGMLRAIGAMKGQLAQSQLAGGLVIGVLGAAIGVPLGIAMAWSLLEYFRETLDVTLDIPLWGVAMSGLGAIAAGLAGAAFPAWKASRVSPLEALASRSVPPRRRGVLTVLGVGLGLAILHVLTVTVIRDGQVRFWVYLLVGLPSLVTGFFLLSVPVMMLVTQACAGTISRVLRLPPHLLARGILATPYRYGFTAGSMMMGLALMVGIWTQGRAIRQDWLGKLEFPDAFVGGLNLNEASLDIVRALPEVTDACAITLQPVETDSFGIKALQRLGSTFIAFEPEKFFEMAKPIWVQGDLKSAVARLHQGGAVIVAREFTTARGLGLGDHINVRANGREFSFEIAGVVTSPGLEVVSQFFSIGEDFTQQSVHAVFGTREDLKDKFGSDAVHLIQVGLKPGADDALAVQHIKDALAGAGILDAGSGRKIKEQINQFVHNGLLAFSFVAIAAMLIAGLGVANLIIAGINARQYEFGVLEAIGASRGLVGRLVLAEAMLIAIAAALLGTWMGLQGVFAVQHVDQKLLGITLTVHPPWDALSLGWGITLVMTLGAAGPAVWWLTRQNARELLGAVRG